jgi:chemotaxis protein CheD
MEGRPLHSIHIGGVFAERRPSVVRTVLGSCIAVCLRDPAAQTGGMNHFMLPMGTDCKSMSCARYGVQAMELLINACMHEGADRRRLEAKVFGGGHVLKIRESDGNVPQSNIRFAMEFLATEGIPIVSKDLGGYSAREVYFFTDSGRTLLKRLAPTGDTGKKNPFADLEAEEREQFKRLSQLEPASDDNVTLF